MKATRLPVAAAVLAVGLCMSAIQNVHMMNADGIAYMRIAHYWATGQTGLMVSGYWGPLLSWLMAPWLWIGMEPLTAARVAMAISGFWFWVGMVRLA